jgi:adenosine kinase
MVKALIVTEGADGSLIYVDGQQLRIPSVKATSVLDPTGCGDAYRAGLLYGITQGFDWPAIGRLASLMGSIKIACRGGQNHIATRDEIGARYREAFGASIW